MHLITQPDHAHLAASIIAHSVRLASHPRHAAILHAVAEHDNGWAEEDAAPIVNPSTGQIADFVNVPLAVRHRVWPRAIHRLEPHPWPAALVAHHAVVVYDRFRHEAGWTPFFDGMEAARARLITAAGCSFDDLESDYEFVRLADLISLAFCMASTQQHRFGIWTVQCSGDAVNVTPDPFGRSPIPFEITAKTIALRPFHSDAELREAVHAAAPTVLRGAVSGAPALRCLPSANRPSA